MACTGGKLFHHDVGPFAKLKWMQKLIACYRISAIMETLAGVTNIPFADQILMCDKGRLDPMKTLAAYSLPVIPDTWTRF